VNQVITLPIQFTCGYFCITEFYVPLLCRKQMIILHLIHFIPMYSQLEFALEPFLYPQNVILYDAYIEQVIINLELVLRPREAIKMN